MPKKKIAIKYPEQMTLFETFIPSNSDRHSNLIEIYDSLPKFISGQREFNVSEENTKLMTNRKFILNDKETNITVTPAILTGADSKNKLIYPSEREAVIEDILRKFAANGQLVEIDGIKGVQFTLRQIKSELEKHGRTLSIYEIKEALLVLNSSTIKCSNSVNKILSSTFLPVVFIADREKYEDNPKIKCFAQFNPLVDASIKSLKFRQYDYLTNINIKNAVARQLHKHLSMVWKQASTDNPYRFSMVNFLTNTSRGITSRLANDRIFMRKVLDALVKSEVISSYKEDPKKSGRKLTDVIFYLSASEVFIKEIRLSNTQKNIINYRK